MDSFAVTTTLDRGDWKALLQACGQRAQARRQQFPLRQRMLPQLPWVGLVVVLAVLYSTVPDFNGSIIVSAALLFLVYVGLLTFVQSRLYGPDENGAFVGTSTFEFSPAGFSATRAHCRTQMEWAMLRDVTRTPTHIFLWIDAISAYCLRAGDLPAPLTPDQFVARLDAFKAAASPPVESATGAAVAVVSPDNALAPAPEALPPAPAQAPPRLRDELLALLRLPIRLPPNPLHLVGRDITIVWLGVFNVLLWVLFQRLAYDGEGGRIEFMWWGVADLARYVVFVLCVGWVLARLASPPLPVRRTLLLVLSFLPLLSAASTFIDEIPRGGVFLLTIALLVFAGNFLEAGVRAMNGSAQPRAVTAAIAVALGLIWFAANYTFPSALWHSPEDYERSERDTVDREQLLFDQPARIDAQIARMSAPPADAAAVYFVGFAGFGAQRVFAEEIHTAASVVGKRYESSERQLLLVNDRRDEETLPYATAPALRYGLAQIGKRMDRERDVLFLALSSHGSEDATLSVSNEAFYWNDLSGVELREMLDESGIQWRVIVISACHAGSFIEHLKDERTIVLTAAAKDRTSFGCSDDRDLTYFGEAFYRDALPSAANLRAAFDAARTAIGARETQEDVSRSDPQADFGALMERKLTELEVPTSVKSGS